MSGLLCSRTGCQSLGTSQPDPSTRQMQMAKMTKPNTQSSAVHALWLLQSWKRLGLEPVALYSQVLGTVWDVGQARDHLQQHSPRACPVWKAESLSLSGCCWSLAQHLHPALLICSRCCRRGKRKLLCPASDLLPGLDPAGVDPSLSAVCPEPGLQTWSSLRYLKVKRPHL